MIWVYKYHKCRSVKATISWQNWMFNACCGLLQCVCVNLSEFDLDKRNILGGATPDKRRHKFADQTINLRRDDMEFGRVRTANC